MARIAQAIRVKLLSLLLLPQHLETLAPEEIAIVQVTKQDSPVEMVAPVVYLNKLRVGV